ncbi:hypothetical protein ACFY0G_39615 [Streptomyces sp. NPDC001552]|uniref:hypothetical protein n=1 Tax=Streptomyces sp. NPDC001552 TaxID=3364587 RepID=UPI00369F76CF
MLRNQARGHRLPWLRRPGLTGALVDPYEKLLDQARETARTLVSRGIAPRPYADDGGQAVEGWKIKQLPAVDRDHYRGPSDWEERRSSLDLLLTTDGRFFTYLEIESAGSRASEPDRLERTRYLKHESAQFLVGLGPGNPFAAVASMLERMPWTAVGYMPPTVRPVQARPAPPPKPPPPPPPPAPAPAPASAPAGSVGGALVGLVGGFMYGSVVGLIGAIVLGVVLLTASLADDVVGPATMAFAVLAVVTCTVVGSVRGWRRTDLPR